MRDSRPKHAALVALVVSVRFRRFPQDGRARPPAERVARPAGLEPATPGLEGRLSDDHRLG